MDNFYKNCPARMNDARFMTNYKSSTSNNELIKYANNITRDDDYRLFLQKNANKLINSEWENLKKTSSCRVNECIHNYPTRVSPISYCNEKAQYDSLQDKKRKVVYKCENFSDYRLTN